MKKCLDCQKEIDDNAKKCEFCQSYQDYRRFLNQGITILSLLVALISVIAYLLPKIDASLNNGTRFQAHLLFTDKSHKINVFVSNTGTRPGVIESATFNISNLYHVSSYSLEFFKKYLHRGLLEKISGMIKSKPLNKKDFRSKLKIVLGKDFSESLFSFIEAKSRFNQYFEINKVPFDLLTMDDSISTVIKPGDSELIRLNILNITGDLHYKDFYRFFENFDTMKRFAESNECKLSLQYKDFDGATGTIDNFTNNCRIYFPLLDDFILLGEFEESNSNPTKG